MINSIKISNYLTCKSINIILKQPLTFLIGKNAVGKTNTLLGIFHASKWCFIDLEKGNYNKDFTAEFSLEYIKNDLSHHFIYKYKIYGEKEKYIKDSLWIIKNGEKKLLFRKTGKTTLTFYFKGKKEKVRIPLHNSGLKFLFDNIVDERYKNFSNYNWVILKITLEFIKIQYYNNQQTVDLPIILKNNFEEWFKDKSKKDSEIFVYKFYDFYKNNSEIFNEYKKILIKLNLLEDIVIIEYIPEEVNEFDTNSLTNFIVIFFIINGENLIFSALSDGTKRMLTLLFSFFYEKPSLMLIEEPENSIHWRLLSNYLDILNQYVDNTNKVLFTTHSDHVLNKLKPEQLICLYSENGYTKTKYLTGTSLNRVKNFMNEIGPLGEYIVSGGLEEEIDG